MPKKDKKDKKHLSSHDIINGVLEITRSGIGYVITGHAWIAWLIRLIG